MGIYEEVSTMTPRRQESTLLRWPSLMCAWGLSCIQAVTLILGSTKTQYMRRKQQQLEVLDSISDGINADSNLLQAAGVPVEIVGEETKILQAVKDRVCSDKNPQACCQYCNMCDTCRVKCGDLNAIPFDAVCDRLHEIDGPFQKDSTRVYRLSYAG